MATSPVVSPAASAPPAAAPSYTPSPSASLNDAIDALPVTTDIPTESAAPPNLGPPETETPAAEPVAEPEAPPAEEAAPADTPATPPTDEEPTPFDDIKADSEYTTNTGAKRMSFSPTKANALFAARDFQRRIMSEVPNATVEDIAANYQRTIELDRMLSDHESGDPSRVDSVMGQFVNPNANPASLMAIADAIPLRLSQTNAAAFARLESNILSNKANRLYEEAARTGNEKTLQLAQHLDYQMTGRFRDAADLQKRDPLADQRTQLAQQQATFAQQQQQAHQQWVERQMESAEGDIDKAVQEQVSAPLSVKVGDKTLEKIVSALPGGADRLNILRGELEKLVESAIDTTPAWKANFDLQRQRFRDNPSDKGTRDALITTMRQYAKIAISRGAKAKIEALTGDITSQSAAAHSRQAAASARVEPVNGAQTPVQRGSLEQNIAKAKASGMTLNDPDAWKLIGW